MSKLTFLTAVLAVIALTSTALSQQPASQGNPLLIARAPQGAGGGMAPVSAMPMCSSHPQHGMPRYVSPTAGMTYAPEGAMPSYPNGAPMPQGEVVYMSPDEAFMPEGYASQPYVDQGWMDDGGYGCDDRGCRSGHGHFSPYCDDRGCPCHFGGACRHAGDSCGPTWYMRAEAVWLRRADGPTRNLIVYDDDGADPLEDMIVLGTNDLDLETALGLRWTLGRYISERTSIEGSFYGLHDWDDSRRTVLDEANQPYNPYWGDDNESSFDISAFADSAQYVLSYDTNFDSAELGVRRWWRSDTSFLAGFRYMQLDERLRMISRDQGTIDPTAIGLYDVQTENDLFGAQVGTEFVRQLWVPWLYFNVEGKAGAYLNSAKHKSSLAVTTPASAIDSKSESEIGFATAMELSLGLSIQLTDRFSLRGGYTVNMLKNGIATAPDQLDLTPQRFNSREYVNTDGSVTLHGAYFGGEWIWY